jgi:hypothetical protein
VLLNADQIEDHDLNLAGQEPDRERTAAVERHVDHVGAGDVLEQFGRDVGERAGPMRAIVQLAGVGLGIGDQFARVVDGQRRVDHQDIGA